MLGGTHIHADQATELDLSATLYAMLAAQSNTVNKLWGAHLL